MSVLYSHLHKGEPIEVAIRQLSLRYGHVRYARTGVLDHFLERYWADTGGDRTQFLRWVDEVYDRDAFTAAFHANGIASFVVDKVLRARIAGGWVVTPAIIHPKSLTPPWSGLYTLIGR